MERDTRDGNRQLDWDECCDRELSKALHVLADHVRDLRDGLKTDTREIVAVDLDTLIAEATSPAPRREYLAIATQGLRQTEWPAGEPVLEDIERVCSRLGL